jgi:uncharacterized protein YutE (UPF0331/DUF86 family)
MVRRERRRALDDALDDLRSYRRQYTLDHFLTDRHIQRQVLHALYTAVQASIDEAVAACSANGIDAGNRYRDAFLALGTAGLIDAELASRMADWASFRNVLAHFYPVLDLRRVYGALDEIEDLEVFRDWARATDAASGP